MTDWDIEYKIQLMDLLANGGESHFYTSFGIPKDLQLAVDDKMVKLIETCPNHWRVTLTKKGIAEAERLTIIYRL